MKSGQLSKAVLSCGLVLGFLLGGCGGEHEAAKQRSSSLVGVELVQEGPFMRQVGLTGTVEATKLATLSSPAEGPVRGLDSREGDAVTAGEVLLGIGRDSSAEAALAAALEEQVRTANDYERMSELQSRGAVSQERVDAARAALARARSQVAAARQSTGDYVITAPWAGIVTRVHVADGRYVGPRAALIDIYDPQSMVLRFSVTEVYAFSVNEGDRIMARFDAAPQQEYELRVVRAWPELDRRMRMRRFEAALPDGRQQFVPGQFARLRLALEVRESAITVAEESLLPTDGSGRQRVMVVDEAGKVSLREVATGFSSAGRRLITSGLEPGERVVVDGMATIQPGQTVNVTLAERGRK